MDNIAQWSRWDRFGIGAGLAIGTLLLLGSGRVRLLGVACIVIAGGLALRDRSTTHRAEQRVLTDGGTDEIELVTAIIRPGKLNAVKQALAEAGAPALTVTNVSGRGTQPSETGQWRGEEYIVDLHQKVKIECVVSEVPSERVIEAIQEAAHTGAAGDGKIFVMPISDACRVSTKERGPDAV